MQVKVRSDYSSRTLEGQVRPDEIVCGMQLIRNWVTGTTYGLFADRQRAARAYDLLCADRDIELVFITSSNIAELRGQLADNIRAWQGFDAAGASAGEA